VPGIADWLPDADVVTRHETSVRLPPREALAVTLATPAAPDAVVRALLALRGLRAGRRTLGTLFPELERTPDEVVFGFSAAPWRPTGGERGSFEDAGPGTVRIAASFRAEPFPGGSRVSTETRVAAVDEPARRAFKRYWRLVGPFSGLVRRRWLAAVRRRAERAAAGS
jgi:hypothetical protein